MNKDKNLPEFPRYYIEGTAGVLHVRSSDIINSLSGQRQLNALKKIKVK